MTRRAVTVVLLLLASCISEAQSAPSKDPSQPNKARIRCTVSIKDMVLRADRDNKAIIGIRNNSARDVTVASMTVYLSPSIYMDTSGGPIGTSYVAYVNLATEETLEFGKVQNSTWSFDENPGRTGRGVLGEPFPASLEQAHLIAGAVSGPEIRRCREIPIFCGTNRGR